MNSALSLALHRSQYVKAHTSTQRKQRPSDRTSFAVERTRLACVAHFSSLHRLWEPLLAGCDGGDPLCSRGVHLLVCLAPFSAHSSSHLPDLSPHHRCARCAYSAGNGSEPGLPR